jgi:catechol-2,3-dioxygenase
MPAHRIAHYNFRLSRDLMKRVADFYIKVVGLEIGQRPAFRSHGIWLYADGEDLLHLSEEEEGDKRQIGSNLTFDHVAIECSNWPEYELRLVSNAVEYQVDHVPGTGIRQVFFRDPAGNGVELIFKRSEASQETPDN